MLINFVGCPHSGKTTLAANLFQHFKSNDIPSEFITEKARQYIVEKRFKEKLVAGQKVYLTNEDQYAIMKQQLMTEAAYVYTIPTQTFIVSDSSPFNTLLYLDKEARQSPEVKKIIAANLSLNPVVFWARVTPGIHTHDTNRIHSEELSRKLDEEIPEILKEFAPELKYFEISGNSMTRFNISLTHLLNYI